MMNNGIMKRYQHSIKTRFHGVEDQSPMQFYTSILSDGPVAFISKVEVSVPHKNLSTQSFTWKSNEGKQKGEKYNYSFDFSWIGKDYIVHTIHPIIGKRIYITIPIFHPQKSILSLSIDGIKELLWKEIMGQGATQQYSIKKEQELIDHCRVTKIEMHIDMNVNIGSKLIQDLRKFRTIQGYYEVPDLYDLYENDMRLKVFQKNELIVRLSVVLGSHYFRNIYAPDILSTPDGTFSYLWPSVVDAVKYAESEREQPYPITLHRGLNEWTTFAQRINSLELSDIAESMLRQGKYQQLF